MIRVPVRHGDLVVLATDGLFDNVHEEEILRCVHRWTREEGDLMAAAAEGRDGAWEARPLGVTSEDGGGGGGGGASGEGGGRGSRRAVDLLRSLSGDGGVTSGEDAGDSSSSSSSSLPSMSSHSPDQSGAGIGEGTVGGSDGAAARLAAMLADVARERAVDKRTDSPFALVAKEHDILWSGGMPDDVTVVVLRVVGAGGQGQGHASQGTGSAASGTGLVEDERDGGRQ